MHYPGLHVPAIVGGLFLVACSDSTGPGGSPPLECSTGTIQSLGVGEHVIVDPFQAGACVRIPPAGATGAEYLYVPVATEGNEVNNGVSAPFSIQGSSPTVATVAGLPSPLLSDFRRTIGPQVFHGILRQRERVLSLEPEATRLDEGRIARALEPPPVVGEQRTFSVCANQTCDEFVAATGTARFVGQKIAIFLDNTAPAGGYTDADLADVGNLFDDHLYAIATSAFGSESDRDGNGVVMVMLTPRVNTLGGCAGNVTVGYFFGGDLLPGNPGSNAAEVFFGFAPDESNLDCPVTREFALSHLPTAFVHEFQHMISFNQHHLIRGRRSEETWLNEGLSHFAEELAGRRVPDTECPVSGSCFSDFLAQGNVVNAFRYLESPEEFFLVLPGESAGTLEERGANWLFVRWLVDHFAADPLSGDDFTRRLVQTNLTGADNVEAQTGVPFSILAPEWQLTNYLDDLPGFSAPTGRLHYKTWNFRDIAAGNALPFPLVPDSTDGSAYSHVGILRAGSGKHVRVVQPPGFAAVDLQLLGGPGDPFPSEVAPRIALVRIR